jgi:hypothetical protein
MKKRLRLRRGDGEVYLDRWGWRCHWFGVYLHRMTAPDPGIDLHDHPWPFVSLILRGGYVEERAESREAPRLAFYAEAWPTKCRRGMEMEWRAGSIHRLRADECHRIISLRRVPTWTLVLTGRRFRNWGFYEPTRGGGFVSNVPYSTARRDLYAEDIGS